MRQINLQLSRWPVRLVYAAPEKSLHEVVLFLHGWRSSGKGCESYSEPLRSLGYMFAAYDFRGMGCSKGDITKLSRKDFLEDTIEVYDWLVCQSGVKKVTVVGSSFGAYIACPLTAERRINRLVLKVPANFPNEGFSEPQVSISDQLDAQGLKFKIPRCSTLSIDALQNFPRPVLIVTSGKDTVISREMSQSFIDAVDDPELTHREMMKAPHGISKLPQFQKEFEKILLEWLEQSDGS